MHIERLVLSGFRGFGPEPTTIDLTPGLTSFLGANGAGKTAAMQAMQRLFGITADQRRLQRQDFHIPANEDAAPGQRTFFLEAILALSGLHGDGGAAAVPDFSTRWRRTKPVT